MTANFLFDGPPDAPLLLVLAHGAGAAMDSPFMAAFAEGLGAKGWRVARFEFAYMASRRRDGGKRPPPRGENLVGEWQTVIDHFAESRPRRHIVIGGKSLGGRVASLAATEAGVGGLVCLGYPFHPPGKPERLRTVHLEALAVPTLIVQGERDPFGTAQEVPTYHLSPAIRFHWAPDGDHGLKPRKASGHSEAENWQNAIEAIDGFLSDLPPE